MKVEKVKWAIIHLFCGVILFGLFWYNISWERLGLNTVLALLVLDAAYLIGQTKQTLIKVFSGLVWFVLYPATFYMVTELVHLAEWLDPSLDERNNLIKFLLYILSIAFGLLVAGESVRLIMRHMKMKTWILRYLLILILSAYGSLVIYMVFYGRFSSWTVLLTPYDVLATARNLLTVEAVPFIAGFTFLQTMTLMVIDTD